MQQGQAYLVQSVSNANKLLGYRTLMLLSIDAHTQACPDLLAKYHRCLKGVLLRKVSHELEAKIIQWPLTYLYVQSYSRVLAIILSKLKLISFRVFLQALKRGQMNAVLDVCNHRFTELVAIVYF